MPLCHFYFVHWHYQRRMFNLSLRLYWKNAVLLKIKYSELDPPVFFHTTLSGGWLTNMKGTQSGLIIVVLRGRSLPCRCSLVQTHMRANTYTHKYTQTHTYTYIQCSRLQKWPVCSPSTVRKTNLSVHEDKYRVPYVKVSHLQAWFNLHFSLL